MDSVPPAIAVQCGNRCPLRLLLHYGMLTASQTRLCPAMLTTVRKQTCCNVLSYEHCICCLANTHPPRRSLRCRARMATPRDFFRVPAARHLPSRCITSEDSIVSWSTRLVPDTVAVAAGSTSSRWRRCTTSCTRSGSRTWAASSTRPTSSTTSSGPSLRTGGWRAVSPSHDWQRCLWGVTMSGNGATKGKLSD